MWIGAATMKNSMEIPQKLKMGNGENRIWSKYSTFWHLSEENKNADSKRLMQPHVHDGTVYTRQDMETTKVSVNGWMDKENMESLM